jgi:Predicted membrane protein (DUF2254)
MSASSRKQWAYPILLLSGVAVTAFFILYTIDLLSANGEFGYFDFDASSITDAVGTMSSMIAAVLGIIITVVSIVVQLSAERFTHVTEMFFRDRTNRVVMGFYLVGCIAGIMTSLSLRHEFVPVITLTAMLAVALVSFALMAPYFTYVFDFLQPEKIIGRIRTDAFSAAEAGAQTTAEATRRDSQAMSLAGMEQLTDIIINSVSSKDKIIAISGVDALKDFAVAYLDLKKSARPDWHLVGPGIRKNPDFVSMAPESIDDLERRRTWVEWKVLRQYQAVYGEALSTMKDVCYVVAIDTRYIGETAVRTNDREALGVVVKFFNSYLRATLNARDVRTAYNLLHQYRSLVEGLLRAGWHDKALEVAGYLKYYGHVAFRGQLAFVTETAAYDLCTLCELAHAVESPVEGKLLDAFLEVDASRADGEAQETGLRGVRKAQAKLASFYLVSGVEPMARRIFEDMRLEKPERLRSIRDELLAVKTEDFWEIIDRGTNFDYLAPERKAALQTFFNWFPRVSEEIPAQFFQSQEV